MKIGYCISQYCRVPNTLMSATAWPKNYCNPIIVVLFWRLDFMSLLLKLNECTMYYRRYKKLICLSKIAIWYCCYMYSINDTCFVYCRQNNWVFREGLKKRTQKHNPQALKQLKANGIKIRQVWISEQWSNINSCWPASRKIVSIQNKSFPNWHAGVDVFNI